MPFHVLAGSATTVGHARILGVQFPSCPAPGCEDRTSGVDVEWQSRADYRALQAVPEPTSVRLMATWFLGPGRVSRRRRPS